LKQGSWDLGDKWMENPGVGLGLKSTLRAQKSSLTISILELII